MQKQKKKKHRRGKRVGRKRRRRPINFGPASWEKKGIPSVTWGRRGRSALRSKAGERPCEACSWRKETDCFLRTEEEKCLSGRKADSSQLVFSRGNIGNRGKEGKAIQVHPIINGEKEGDISLLELGERLFLETVGLERILKKKRARASVAI